MAATEAELHGASVPPEPPSGAIVGPSDHIVEEPTDLHENLSEQRPVSRRPAPQTRNTRKKRKQQQFQRALAAMMESFQGIFEDSDADVSDFDDAAPHPGQDPTDDAYATPLSDDDDLRWRAPRNQTRTRSSRRVVEYERGPINLERSPSRSTANDHPDNNDDVDFEPRSLARRGTVLEEVKPGPISFETELYEYSRSPDGEFDEPLIVDVSGTQAPRKVSRLGARAGLKGSNETSYVFKVVSMYSVPARSRQTQPEVYDRGVSIPYPRRNSYGSGRETYPSRVKDYPSGRPARPISVNAGLGNYLVIYSGVIMNGIRNVVKVYPGISRAFDFMIVPAPYTLIVHYRDELKAYSDALPDEPSSAHDDVSSPTVANTDDHQTMARAEYLEPRKHIPLLLDYVFTPDFSAVYDQEMSLRKKTSPSCTYTLAWLLFKPGSMVYAWTGDSLDAYIVDWYELEGLYGKPTSRRKTYGLATSVRPPNATRGDISEFSLVPKSIIVRLHYLEYDGSRIGRRPRIINITPFEGEREITSLPVFPIEFAKDPKIKDSLVARGQKYVKLCERHYMSYHGDTIPTSTMPSRKVNGRVMIDSSTYYNDAESVERLLRLKVPTEDGIIQSETSSASDSSGVSDYRYQNRRRRRTYRRRIRDAKKDTARARGMAEYDLVDPTKVDLNPEQFMLFPTRIWGFVLRERRWYLLHIDGLKDPVFQENIIDDLVLKDEAKNLIEALSNTHSSGPAGSSADKQESEGFNHWSADIVQSKGEGRIFLLHGKPGVGKTSTAECVAEASQVPLLAITCGDLGIEPHEVERALMKWFKLATLWKAVLLLDEADVYLESRMSGDLARNSLVSIFLRALEYYQGVLFLTTNRVGTFDEAMLSRIHVVLHYADFEDSERQKIWTTSFRKLGEERPDVKVGPGVMDYALENPRVLDLKWNGREIRNAFNTIVALAEFDAERKRRAGRPVAQVVLERSHLVQVVKMSEEFKKYMKSTRGLDESALAKALKIRDDAAMQTIRDFAHV